MSSSGLLEQFARVGRILFEAGLNNSHSGNMSVRLADRLVITRHGAMLGELASGDLVEVELSGRDHGAPPASTEIHVHRAIYAGTSHRAVIHCHPRTATALSLAVEAIVPVDFEGRFHFKRVPVLGRDGAPTSEELARELPPLLGRCPIAMARGHGAFAAAADLEEGLKLSSALEWSCDIIARLQGLGAGGGTPGGL